MGPLPSGTKPDLDLQVHRDQEVDGYRIRLVSYLSEAEDRVPAYLLLPARTGSRLSAVLCLHETISIGRAEPAGLGGKPNLHYAAELARRNKEIFGTLFLLGQLFLSWQWGTN